MAARRTSAKPTVADAAAAVKEAPPEEAPNGVLVVKTIEENGGVRTSLQLIGDCQITEVQTLLELGLKAFRADVGLDGQSGR